MLHLPIPRRRFLKYAVGSAACYGVGCSREKVDSVVEMTQALDPFDPDLWQQRTGVKPSGTGASLVVGPVDAIELIASRQRLEEEGCQFGEPSPADVFLFCVGEPTDRSKTKVGGLPYLHLGDPWPSDSKGAPLPFVAQMSFLESKDIVGEGLPGDILLVFGNLPSDESSPEVVLLWKTVTADANLVAPENLPCVASFDAFYGVRWRTANYPSAFQDPRNEGFVDSDLDDVMYASGIFATQVSRAPFLLARDRESMEDTVLCCFAPVVPARDGRYPFCNVVTPLLAIRGIEYQYDSRYRYVEQWLTWGDSTSLYILQDKNGNIKHDFIIG